jgi:hypothetical protein
MCWNLIVKSLKDDGRALGPEATGMVRAIWMHSRDKTGKVYSIRNREEGCKEGKFVNI